MYFKRLEMHGFKSFAEPVVIEFHEGVTCIVGPNGSGKSNISDAIRWVLGEQSPKMLRGGKMEEVIFAGTANRKSRGMAEVTLVIDNSTGRLPIDYNEVAITRRMFRSGESEYLINNNQCRLRDIRELIMDTGIGVDGYSLIGQGKIADIVSNKPESRREIFEEAAGIVMYKSKKAESERKLQSTNNNLERVNDIIGEIEGRIDGLKEDSIKAKEYLELKEKYRDLEINITLKNIDNLSGKNLEIKSDIESLQTNIEEILNRKKSVDDMVQEDKSKNESLEVLGNEARDNLLIKVEQINQLINKGQLNTERLQTIEKNNKRLSDEIIVLQDKLKNEQLNKDNLLNSKNEFLSNLNLAKEDLEKKVIEYNQVASKSTELAEIIDNKKDRLFKLHNEISSKTSEAKSIESFKETLLKRKSQMKEETQEQAKSKGDTLSLLEGTRKEKDEAETVLKGIKSDIENLKADKLLLIKHHKELTLKSEDLRIKGSQLSSRKKTIEEMENNYEGFSNAVKHTMKAGLSGIEGVVAELMEVPSGFEIAIETALGGAMQNIVCDKDSSAKKAISYLKENKAGRLTFLPVASIKGYKPNVDKSIKDSEGYKGLAVECISFDSRYAGIYEYLLGRVVIVDNMDNAIKLSKLSASGIRFVTLDGEIINASGAITGGKYKNASANLLERKREILELEGKIGDIRISFLENKEQIEKLEKDIEHLENSIIEREVDGKNTELRILTLDNKIDNLGESLEGISTSNEKYLKELESIKRDFDSADNMIKNLDEEVIAFRNEVQVLNTEIEKALSDYESLKISLEKCSETITKVRISVNEWENKTQNVENLISRIDVEEKDLSTQLEYKTKEIEDLKIEKDGILKGSSNVEDDVAALNHEKEELEKYIEEVSRERLELSEKINNIEREQSQVGEKLNSYQDQKYQMEIRVAKNDTQLDSLKEKLFDEFELSYAQAVNFRRDDFIMSQAVKENREIKGRIRELGEVNVGSIKEYEQVSERYKFLTEQRSDILSAMEELNKIISDMDTTIKTKFKENFDQVVTNFEDIFKELFGGGHAELRLEDENNPLGSGIDIIAQPPGKKLQNINLMSGGEKTMTAIALMFAVLKTKPTPFCILDEVEAALDDTNIDRFANYLRKFNGIQFALVTHQKATMEHADVLYGVTMAEKGISKVLSLRLGDNFEL